MEKQKRNRIFGALALTLCLCLALSVMGMGLAKWQTTVTAGGAVTAAGTWDLAVTAADLKVSSGASVQGSSDRCLHLAGGQHQGRHPVRPGACQL